MINFVYGAYGSGKTTEILNRIGNDTKNGIHSFLIIPDQEALQFERLSLSVLPTEAQLNLEILGFSRLYNRVCRELGGLSYSYVTKPIRSLIMWKSLRELAPIMEEYNEKAVKDLSFSDTMISSINEFKANGITAAGLEIVASKLQKDSPLARRLRDISLIYSCFDNFVSEKYTDSADDLAKLRDMLRENDFFSGTSVYLDSFYSYTAVQHQIIEEIFKSADNVTLTVPLSHPDSDDISTEGIRSSLKRLIDSAARFGGHKNIVLTENKRAHSSCLSFLSQNIWRLDASNHDAPLSDGSIVSEICDNRYAEAEAVTAHILELLRGGARCKEIVIIARDAEKYRGIIDTALKKSSIPYFFDQKSDLCSMPSVKFILSALKIKKYNWQRQDVISYIKTGMCDIDTRDADLFEEYVNTWSIRGSQFLDGVWTMNPDGLVATISERGTKILEAANRVREKITAPLEKFFILLDAAEDVCEMCKATYSYIEEIGLEKKLHALSIKAAECGDIKQAQEFSRLYEIMVNTLAEVAQALEGENADSEEFMQILRSVFDKTEIGSIPTSIDEVTIGNASMLRASNAKYAFVIGLCEGEFPAIVTDKGILSSTDRATLADIGLELKENVDARSSDELMFVQRAFSVPSERLFVFTHKAELNGTACFPSLGFTRIQKLFPDLKPHDYKMSDLEYAVPSAKNAISIFRSLEDGEKKESLRIALGERIPGFSSLSNASSSASECRISPSTAELTVGKRLYTSSTSFEKYASCPFNYFCSNVLRLRDKATSQFRSNDIGTFVHYILEILIKHAIPSDPNDEPADDETLIKLADDAVKAHLENVCPRAMIDSKRMQHLYARLKSLALLLVKNTVTEFSKSQFRPVFFELRANGQGSNPSPLVFSLNHGGSISFSGMIDRVDVYKSGNDVYIRVVDYKTGSKTFSIDDLEHGINMQMLLYLFTLCRSKTAQFKESIGIEADRDALPAGVIYLSAAIPTIEAEDYSNPEKTFATAEEKLSRTGLVLDNEDILYAMNSDFDSKFLAKIKRKKDGSFSGDALTSAERFARIYDELEATVIKIANELIEGVADARPLEYGGTSPCEYCSSKPICRKNKSKGGNYGVKELD